MSQNTQTTTLSDPIAITHEDLCRMYAQAYALGHHDTVESQYTDVFQCDRATYWADNVDEFLTERTLATIHPAGGAGEAVDAARYRHRRSIEVSNMLSMSGVMAISPDLYRSALDRYDAETDAFTHEQVDFD